MAGPTLAQLLRWKGMVDSAAATEAEGAAATALSEAYMRLRDQIGNVLGGELSDEFNEAFPSIDIPSQPRAVHEMMRLTSAAYRAKVLLGQLAGWLDGLIAEQTLEQRIRAEAEARVRAEQKKPPGFSA